MEHIANGGIKLGDMPWSTSAAGMIRDTSDLDNFALDGNRYAILVARIISQLHRIRPYQFLQEPAKPRYRFGSLFEQRKGPFLPALISFTCR